MVQCQVLQSIHVIMGVPDKEKERAGRGNTQRNNGWKLLRFNEKIFMDPGLSTKSRHIIIKLLKPKAKRILKAAREKWFVMYKRIILFADKNFGGQRAVQWDIECWKEKKKPASQEFYIQHKYLSKNKDEITPLHKQREFIAGRPTL